MWKNLGALSANSPADLLCQMDSTWHRDGPYAGRSAVGCPISETQAATLLVGQCSCAKSTFDARALHDARRGRTCEERKRAFERRERSESVGDRRSSRVSGSRRRGRRGRVRLGGRGRALRYNPRARLVTRRHFPVARPRTHELIEDDPREARRGRGSIRRGRRGSNARVGDLVRPRASTHRLNCFFHVAATNPVVPSRRASPARRASPPRVSLPRPRLTSPTPARALSRVIG